MPMNGMMTLADVVDAGIEGRDDRQRQDQYQRGLKQQQVGDAAGARAQQAFQTAMQNGGDRDVAMLKATEEYSRHFAENGQWQDFLKHEAAVQPQRMRVRAQALQNFQAEGGAGSPDAVKKLLARVYATVPDGNDIAEVQMLPGGAPVDRGTAPTAAKPAPAPTLEQGLAAADAANTNPLGQPQPQTGMAGIVQPGRPGDGRLGAPSGPAALRVKLTNGDVRPVDLGKMLADIQKSLQDPVKAAESENRLNYERALHRVKTAGLLVVEGEKGRQSRMTEKEKAAAREAEGQARFKQQATLADADHAAALQRTRESAAATTGAAKIRAGADGKDPGNKRDQVFDQLHDELIRGYGIEQLGSMSGQRAGDDYTAAAARYARDLVKEGKSFNEALGIASKEVKKRRAAAQGGTR